MHFLTANLFIYLLIYLLRTRHRKTTYSKYSKTSLCGRDGRTICGPLRVCHCNSLGGATWRSVMITGQTDRRTDRRTDRVRRNMRPPPREEDRIIRKKSTHLIFKRYRYASLLEFTQKLDRGAIERHRHIPLCSRPAKLGEISWNWVSIGLRFFYAIKIQNLHGYCSQNVRCIGSKYGQNVFTEQSEWLRNNWQKSNLICSFFKNWYWN